MYPITFLNPCALVPSSQLSSAFGSVSVNTAALAVAAFVTAGTVYLTASLGPLHSISLKLLGLAGHFADHVVNLSDLRAASLYLSTSPR